MIILGLIFLLYPIQSYASFSYSISVTTNHLKVPSTQTNFPVLATSTIATMKTVGNGGHVQNANGYDIYCYSDSVLTTRIPCEREKYVASTGELVMWVKVSSLSSSADNVVYYGYGDASVSTDPNLDATYGAAAVWDSNYRGVWHLPNGSSLNVTDSTAINTSTNHSATAVTGQIDGGAGFFSATIDGGAGTIGASVFTASTWVNPSVTSRGDLVTKWVSDGEFNLLYGLTAGKPQFFIGSGSNSGVGATAMTTGTWNYVVGTYDGTTISVYLNGVLQSSTTASPALITGRNYTFGNNLDGDGPLNGSLDEVRVSSSARSADWITTEYNNQSNVATFVTFGSETPVVTTPTYSSRVILFSGKEILNSKRIIP